MGCRDPILALAALLCSHGQVGAYMGGVGKLPTSNIPPEHGFCTWKLSEGCRSRPPTKQGPILQIPLKKVRAAALQSGSRKPRHAATAAVCSELILRCVGGHPALKPSPRRWAHWLCNEGLKNDKHHCDTDVLEVCDTMDIFGIWDHNRPEQFACSRYVYDAVARLGIWVHNVANVGQI